jgi:hypothetical protein
VVIDEELIEGLSFSAYHRVSTAILVPAPSGSAIEMVTIDPLDLEAALEREAASPHPALTNWAAVPPLKIEIVLWLLSLRRPEPSRDPAEFSRLVVGEFPSFS